MSAATALNRQELHASAALAAVFFLRMLGLFMLIPVLALYAGHLAGASPFMVGLAIGIYGLTQASLQIPFGALSDRVGRRPVIVGGLLIFTCGSLIAAMAQHIAVIALGRAVQGAGAVSGATLALAADLTRPEQRTKVMALIGISIGAAFSLAFVVGPLLNAVLGLRGLFIAAAALGLLAIPILYFGVPRPATAPQPVVAGTAVRALFAPELRVLYVGVLALHLVLAASFVAIPVGLREGLQIAAERHYAVYLPVLLGSLVLVTPLVMLSARPGYARWTFYGAILGLGLAELTLWWGWQSAYVSYAGLVLFFTAFNYLEASLPGLISRVAPSTHKGTALGAYSTFQFIGMFAGGVIGGLVAQGYGFGAVPLACAGLSLVWLALACGSPAAALTAEGKD